MSVNDLIALALVLAFLLGLAYLGLRADNHGSLLPPSYTPPPLWKWLERPRRNDEEDEA